MGRSLRRMLILFIYERGPIGDCSSILNLYFSGGSSHQILLTDEIFTVRTAVPNIPGPVSASVGVYTYVIGMRQHSQWNVTRDQ